MELNQRIYNLVQEQYSKMTFSKKLSNQVILSNRCQSIIYNEWEIGNNSIWALVEKYVKEFISDDED